MNYLWGGNKCDDDGKEPMSSQKESKQLPKKYEGAKQEPWGWWCQSSTSHLHIRGANYLSDKKKVEAEESAFRLLHVDFFTSMGARVDNVGAHAASFVRKRRADEEKTGRDDHNSMDDLIFIVNMQVPGEPRFNLILYLQAPPDRGSMTKTAADKAFDVCLSKFVNGTDSYRQSVFKFIPHVLEGGVVVTKTVGNVPVIMGNKLTQEYFYDAELNYMEIDVDVGSSTVAGGILKVAKGYASWLVMDLNFLFEGHSEEELPEKMVGGVRIIYPDLSLVGSHPMSSVQTQEEADAAAAKKKNAWW